jgi:hypothetical protein
MLKIDSIGCFVDLYLFVDVVSFLDTPVLTKPKKKEESDQGRTKPKAEDDALNWSMTIKERDPLTCPIGKSSLKKIPFIPK